ncbi:MAG: nucleotidyltransferase family protein [Bacteroidia bacterium]|nr:nucleotidyltransferase family protein [Bacteroidia bacterium]
MKAMIFAAGLGTRLRPLTNDRPKALVEVFGKPLLEWVILKLRENGIREVVVNVHHFADKIEAFLERKENFDIDIRISDEREFLLETGGGLKFAKDLLQGNDPILIHNADIISDLDIQAFIKSHTEQDALASLAVSERNTSRYLHFDETNQLTGWENIKTSEVRPARNPMGEIRRLAFSGIHLINPEFLDVIIEEGKFSIIEVYLRLAAQKKIIGYQHDSSNWFDVGKPENLPLATAYLKKTNS